MNCKNHQEKGGIYRCAACANSFCTECVIIREVSQDFTAYICKECGGKCEPATGAAKEGASARRERFFKPKEARQKDIPAALDESAAAALKVPQKLRAVSAPRTVTFWGELFAAFFVPMKGKGVFIVLLFSVCLGGFLRLPQLFLFDTLIKLLCGTYALVYLVRIIDSGYRDGICLPPLLGLDYWFSSGKLLALFVMAVALCLVPSHAYLFLREQFDGIFFALLAGGIACIPMLAARVVIFRSMRALNPLGVGVALLRTAGAYAVLIAVFCGLPLTFLYAHFDFFSGYGWYGLAASSVLFVYNFFVAAHILGVFAKQYQSRVTGIEQVRHEGVFS